MSWDWKAFWNSIRENSIESIVGLVVLVILGWILKMAWPQIQNWIQKRKKKRAEIQNLKKKISALERRINRAFGAVGKVTEGGEAREGSGLWLTQPIQKPSNYFMFQRGTCIPIWVFANLKGGVAKTTNATNIAAHFALQGERVLLLDLDYQASASSMGLRDTVRIPGAGQDSRATRMINGDYKAQELTDEKWTPLVANDGMVHVTNFRLIPSAYDLAQAENRLMVEWLLAERKNDIRYTLSRILHHDTTQQNFDRIIIDAPPRLTTACVQALCAATHLIIPTILDKLSAESVAKFIEQVARLKSADVCPHIEVGAIIGYRSGLATAQIPVTEDSIFRALKDAGLSEDLYRSNELVPHKPLLAESAGSVIAVLRNDKPQETQAVQEIFQALATSIEDRINRYAS